MTRYTIPFAELGRHDVATVGGKNSSLGEMIAKLAALHVSVPGGFATTADAYREFLSHDGLGGFFVAVNHHAFDAVVVYVLLKFRPFNFFRCSVLSEYPHGS